MPNYHIGTKATVSEMFKNWLKQFDEVQFVSDVCHYDMVLLIDIFGGALSLFLFLFIFNLFSCKSP